jgi:hypothetical protein
VRGAGRGGFMAVDQIELAGSLYRSFDEAHVREVRFEIALTHAPCGECELRLDRAGACASSRCRASPGAPAARFVRESAPLAGRSRGSSERCARRARTGACACAARTRPVRTRSRARATSRCARARRPAPALRGRRRRVRLARRSARLGARRRGGVRERALVARARGPEGDRALLLAAPIILSDHPRSRPRARRSVRRHRDRRDPLAAHDDAHRGEKREARATDPRAAEIIDRCDHLSPELLDRLHGAVRSLRPVASGAEPGACRRRRSGRAGAIPRCPGRARVMIAASRSRAARGCGSRRRRRADAQDFLLRDRAALVAGVFEDLDGRTYLGVTLEDDPAAEWMPGHGRYYYFFPDEVVPMERKA